MKRWLWAGGVVVFFLLAGLRVEGPAPHAPAPVASEADKEAMRDAEIAWAGAWASGDVERVVGQYADDAVVTIPDAPPMRGKGAIRTGIGGQLAARGPTLTFTPLDKGRENAFAGHGTYSVAWTDPQTKHSATDRGFYVTTFQKMADGSWVVGGQAYFRLNVNRPGPRYFDPIRRVCQGDV